MSYASAINSGFFAEVQLQELPSPQRVKRAKQARLKDPLDYSQIAKRLDAVASVVDSSWGSLSQEQKNTLTSFVDLLEPSSGVVPFIKRQLFGAFFSGYFLAKIISKQEDDLEYVLECARSIRRLRESVLHAVEQESPGYQSDLNDTLESVVFPDDSKGSLGSSEEIRDWLRGISDPA